MFIQGPTGSLEINVPSVTVAQISASSVVCGTGDFAEETPGSVHVESSGREGRPWRQAGLLSSSPPVGEGQGDNYPPLPKPGDAILGIDLAEYQVCCKRGLLIA